MLPRSQEQRLRDAVRVAGGNKVVSGKSGVPTSTLGTYVAGAEWKVSPIVAIAQACGVGVDWLISGPDGTGSPHTKVSVPANAEAELVLTDASGKHYSARSKRYAIIPTYVWNAAEGEPDMEDDATSMMALRDTFITAILRRRQADLVTVGATGDSMEPTIYGGDVLVVDTSVQTIENSCIYVLNVDGVLLVKRLSLRLDGAIMVRSDNPKYDPETVAPDHRSTLHIIGQVVYQAGPPRS